MIAGTLATLMRKDWRLFRAPIVGIIVISLGAYLIGTIVLIEWYHLNVDFVDWPRVWSGSVEGGAQFAMLAIPFIAAAFGATAFAGERRDRSAEFLSVLPPPRGQVALSKFVVAALCLAVSFAIHVGIALIALHFVAPGGLQGMEDLESQYRQLKETSFLFGCWTTMTFGLAWLLSTLINSVAISACVSIAVSVTLLTAFFEMASEYRPSYRTFVAGIALMGVIGVACLLAGTKHVLSRVEP